MADEFGITVGGTSKVVDRIEELRQALPGISPHTLTSRLRQFETHAIVIRTTYAEIPPRVEYRLTPLGEGLRDVLEAMATWADSVPTPEAAPSVMAEGAGEQR
ncbi:winged helix-turn-helix transcriptional regulator [Streptomyces sp. NPDC050416]|uniref:winged helix-turn-helix transcriptional regulator n=1 Tax=Streptomyces sp. NPDC050416 TaxID=3365611 RepID=UPI0037A97791